MKWHCVVHFFLSLYSLIEGNWEELRATVTLAESPGQLLIEIVSDYARFTATAPNYVSFRSFFEMSRLIPKVKTKRARPTEERKLKRLDREARATIGKIPEWKIKLEEIKIALACSDSYKARKAVKDFCEVESHLIAWIASACRPSRGIVNKCNKT